MAEASARRLFVLRQRGEGAAIGAHADSQLAIDAGEHAGVEIEVWQAAHLQYDVSDK